MRHRWVYVDGIAYEVGQEPQSDAHHIIPDIEPFMSPDGKYITGRRAWRDHLKATDSVEMGHSDVKAAQAAWNQKKAAHQERLRGQQALSAQFDAPSEVREVKRSGLAVEMANRLHGRPMPERKEMLKLTLDIAKRMKRG